MLTPTIRPTAEIQRVDHQSRVHIDFETYDIHAEMERPAEAGRQGGGPPPALGGDGGAVEQFLTGSLDFEQTKAGMSELNHLDDRPTALDAILRETADLGFSMASETQTGSLLRTLAASKPAGRFLELGTGTGVATAWLLAGMDKASRLESVDNNPTVVAIARRYLGSDHRVTFHVDDGAAFIERQTPGSYDFVFADAWPGKFSHLEQALALVRVGGLYFVDDLLPQPNWPAGHAATVSALIERLARHDRFVATKLAWASGLIVLVRTR